MRRIATLAAAVAALAACLPGAPPPAAMPEDACGASGLQHLVGRPEAEAQGLSAPGAVRIIRPGMAVTMDYSPYRLNFWLDRRDVIERVVCG